MTAQPDTGLDTLVELVAVGRQELARFGARGAFTVAIGGSVAVGKSHLAAALANGLRARGTTAAVVGTDGFLLANAELESRGLALRKGFPETFDRSTIVDVVEAAKDAVFPLTVPVYDHFHYDVVPDQRREVDAVEVLIVEGLCLLGPGASFDGWPISARFALSVGVDADRADIRRWYRERFVANARRAIDEPGGFWDLFAGASDDELLMMADLTWDTINEPNLREHIGPGVADAHVIVRKGRDHSIIEVIDRRVSR